MISQNRISEIKNIETSNNGNPITSNTISYSNAFAGNASFLPKTISTKKGGANDDIRIAFNNYDEFGNVLELQQESGTIISYIYGYNQTLPIAKIENATYAQVQPYETNLQSLSNTANSEASLLTALDNLRTTFPNAMITTYTHKPLIGVSTITDPKGDKMQYFYDAFNRLDYVLDKDGNKLSENQYNYKP